MAQPQLTKDLSYVMEIPSVVAMESSPAHMYVLSESEGMVLFRSNPDSLQWLYSSTGMQRRGNKMTADIRFAYLFGDTRRLTVLEPTSVLGVYSSTQLPAQPLDAERISQSLFVAMGSEGLGRLSLSTPESVDSAITKVEQQRLVNQQVIDLESSLSQLFVLTDNASLLIFNRDDDQVTFSDEYQLDEPLEHIFVIGDLILGSDSSGSIYEIDGTGNLAEIGSINESVKKIESWQSWLIIKGESNRLWTSYSNREPQVWKSDRDAGNYITVTEDQLWLCEYNQVTRVSTSADQAKQATGGTSSTESTTSELQLKPISNITVPNAKPVLQAIELQGNYPLDKVQFAYQSNIKNATIKGNGFYWQPSSNDAGRHQFKIIATSSDGQVDSTSFTVDVRSFNAPPRFSPIRPITIPVGEPFTLPINATDPDGTDPNLIRYIGVDMPEGATINEQNGRFQWTPSARQIGENSFQVVATDQFGAASQIDVTIRVIEINRSESGD
ncbi:MAG: putative Ig domain-containing protein [Balneolaceae bacterium]|nr:putative Ig domain-containing protein [Balneolaceae bacterium]